MKLLPCPFCENEVFYSAKEKFISPCAVVIVCNNCKLTMDDINQWNKRSNSGEFLRGFLEAKRQMLEILNKLTSTKGKL
jgi:hypothetical protein